jgi:hypothetical protein
MAKATVSYPGVYVEETRTTVKVIPGVDTKTPASSRMRPSAFLAKGYKVVEADLHGGGLELLLGKDNDLVLFRMVEYREGSSTEGQLVVTFVAKVP